MFLIHFPFSKLSNKKRSICGLDPPATWIISLVELICLDSIFVSDIKNLGFLSILYLLLFNNFFKNGNEFLVFEFFFLNSQLNFYHNFITSKKFLQNFKLTPKCQRPFLSFLEFALNWTKCPYFVHFFQFDLICNYTNPNCTF